ASWAVLQYVLGLRDLGFDVLLVEPVAAPTDHVPLAATASARRLDGVAHWADLRGRACLVSPTGEISGLDRQTLCRLAGHADMLLNVSGMLALDDPFDAIPVRAYLDLDPAFNQLWHEACGIDMHFDGHTHHV